MNRIAVALCACLASFACGQVGLDGVETPNFSASPPSAEQAEGLQAVGLILSAASPSGTVISVQLGVAAPAADGTLAWAGGVADPRVHFGAESAPLVTTATPGVFATDNVRFPALQWQPGATYGLSFTVIDADGTSHEVTMLGAAPAADHTVELDPVLIRYVGESLEMFVSNHANGGAVVVTPFNAGGTPTFSSFELADPTMFDDAVSELLAWSDDRVVVPAAAFPSPGAYQVELHNYQVTYPVALGDGSASLGAQSWMAVGRLVTTDVDIE